MHCFSASIFEKNRYIEKKNGLKNRRIKEKKNRQKFEHNLPRPNGGDIGERHPPPVAWVAMLVLSQQC